MPEYEFDYLTTDRLAEMTEFETIASRDAAKLEIFVYRAHSIAEEHGPFPEAADLGDDEAAFTADMEMAVFLVAERIALSNPSTAAQAAGITSEKIGQYQYSRSQGAGVGEPVDSIIIPDEALDIFERWRITDEDEGDFIVERTDVFRETLVEDANEPGRKVLVSEDFGTIAPSYLDDTTGRRYG